MNANYDVNIGSAAKIIPDSDSSKLLKRTGERWHRRVLLCII